MVRVKYPSELYHHGIKGQHWGERRYQNEDGSLTVAGKLRYGVGQGYNRAKTYAIAGINKAKTYGSAALNKSKEYGSKAANAGKTIIKRTSTSAANAGRKAAETTKKYGPGAAKVAAGVGAAGLAITGIGAAVGAKAAKTGAKMAVKGAKTIAKNKVRKKIRKFAKGAVAIGLTAAGLAVYKSKWADNIRDVRFSKKAVKKIEAGLTEIAKDKGVEHPTAIQGFKNYRYDPAVGPLRDDMTPVERYDWYWHHMLRDDDVTTLTAEAEVRNQNLMDAADTRKAYEAQVRQEALAKSEWAQEYVQEEKERIRD